MKFIATKITSSALRKTTFLPPMPFFGQKVVLLLVKAIKLVLSAHYRTWGREMLAYLHVLHPDTQEKKNKSYLNVVLSIIRVCLAVTVPDVFCSLFTRTLVNWCAESDETLHNPG